MSASTPRVIDHGWSSFIHTDGGLTEIPDGRYSKRLAAGIYVICRRPQLRFGAEGWEVLRCSRFFRCPADAASWPVAQGRNALRGFGPAALGTTHEAGHAVAPDLAAQQPTSLVHTGDP